MRLAWFSPLPPTRSGVADVSARLLPPLRERYTIETFTPDDAHDFVWRQRRRPYDLVVYQLGNAACHDYVWAYLARYPGLVVLHDPRLHHARARQLLQAGRFDDYRREFRYDHPGAVADFAEYAVAGLGGPIYYQWPMRRVVMETARAVAVHNPRVAADLRDAHPDTPVAEIRLGTPAPPADVDRTRTDLRSALGIEPPACVFTAFGKITAEKRISAIVRAFARLAGERADVHLVFAGDASDYPALARDVAAVAPGRVHQLGYVADGQVERVLAASDVCLCLRWPTALESSASWLQCLAAGAATIVSDLAHWVDVPTIDPRTGARSHAATAPVAMRVDLIEEEAALFAAMRSLASDDGLRRALGEAGRAYWSANHTMAAMTADYVRAIADAANAPPRRAAVAELPPHWLEDHSAAARAIARAFGVDLDILR